MIDVTSIDWGLSRLNVVSHLISSPKLRPPRDRGMIFERHNKERARQKRLLQQRRTQSSWWPTHRRKHELPRNGIPIAISPGGRLVLDVREWAEQSLDGEYRCVSLRYHLWIQLHNTYNSSCCRTNNVHTLQRPDSSETFRQVDEDGDSLSSLPTSGRALPTPAPSSWG